MRKLLFLITVLPVFLHCKNEKKEQYKNDLTIISIEKSRSKDSIRQSDIITDVSFIPLQTSKECLIGEISSFFMLDTCMIIADSENANAVFVFEKNGRFIRKIGEQGDGPDDYSQIEDVIVNEEKGRIGIIDVSDKLKWYSINGEFINNIDVNGSFADYIDEARVAVYADYHFKGGVSLRSTAPSVCVLDANSGEPLDSGVYFPTWINRRMIISAVYSSYDYSTGGSLFSQGYNDTIYSVSSDGIVPAYFIDFSRDNQKKNSEYLADSKSASSYIELYKKYRAMGLIKKEFIFTSQDKFIFSFYEGEENSVFSLCVYTPSDGKTIIIPNYIHSNAMIRDVDNSQVQLFLNLIGSDKDCIYSCLTMEDIPLGREKYMSSTLFEAVKNSKEGDNPIIVVSHLKK